MQVTQGRSGLPIPETVEIPMSMHIGAPANPVVNPGDYVKVGQLIGEQAGFISAPVHSSVSGTVSVHAANAGEISLETTSGAITGSVRTDKLEADSVSGSIDLALETQPKELEAETTSGDITLTLARQPEAVAIDFHTVSGQLRSDVTNSPDAPAVWKLETVSGNADIFLMQ